MPRRGQQLGQIDRRVGQLPALVEAGQQQEVVDQAGHAAASRSMRRMRRPLVGLVGAAGAVQLGEPADRRQRGAQLVGGVGMNRRSRSSVPWCSSSIVLNAVAESADLGGDDGAGTRMVRSPAAIASAATVAR